MSAAGAARHVLPLPNNTHLLPDVQPPSNWCAIFRYLLAESVAPISVIPFQLSDTERDSRAAHVDRTPSETAAVVTEGAGAGESARRPQHW